MEGKKTKTRPNILYQKFQDAESFDENTFWKKKITFEPNSHKSQLLLYLYVISQWIIVHILRC